MDGDGSSYRGFCKDPYFKIFDGSDFDSSKNKTRVAIYRPEYVIHNNDIWVLDSKELNELIRLINGVTITRMSTWEYIKYEVVMEGEYLGEMTETDLYKIENCNIPDYRHLDFSDKDKKNHKGEIKSWRKKK